MTTPALLDWMWQSTLCLGACWLIYWLTLRHETCFQYNRQFLRYTPWLAILLPVLLAVAGPWLGSWLVVGAAPTALLAPARMLPAVTVAAETGTTLPWWNWLPLVYGAGVVVGLARLGRQLFSLWQITRRLPREPHAGYTLISTGGQLPTSSFGRLVFWDETADLGPTEAHQVLCHELVHVQQGHTWERLYLEVLRAALWFNPFMHCYPRALALTHEYLADAAVLEATPTLNAPATYVALLARLALRRLHPQVPLVHSFTYSPILTRIAMLQSTSSVRRWKQWLVLPVSAVLLVTMACEKAVEPAAPTATADSDSQPAPPPPPAYVTPETQVAPPPPPAVYQYVEQMPEYSGGLKKLLSDLTLQLQYPQSALADKVEGRVFVSFIVAADGSMQAIKIEKGLNAPKASATTSKEMEDAAVAALRNLPGTWAPGKQNGKAVAVSYTIPVNFALRQVKVTLPDESVVPFTYPGAQGE